MVYFQCVIKCVVIKVDYRYLNDGCIIFIIARNITSSSTLRAA
jgi:hypothetical protein